MSLLKNFQQHALACLDMTQNNSWNQGLYPFIKIPPMYLTILIMPGKSFLICQNLDLSTPDLTTQPMIFLEPALGAGRFGLCKCSYRVRQLAISQHYWVFI